MEVISIDGVEYVRAAQVAKRFKYTSDYIGQLCRSGKVDAKLVGRTWYVNQDSLEGHKTTRYVKVSGNEKTSNDSHKVKISRQNVEPVIRKETAKSLTNAGRTSSNFLRRIEWKPLKYETDTAELLPILGDQTQPTKVPVNLAGSTKLKINNQSPETTMVTEPLPEVSLAGRLQVASFDDDFEDDLKNIDISDEEFVGELSGEVGAEPKNLVETQSDRTARPRTQREPKPIADKLNPVYPVAINKTPGSLFVPELVVKRESVVQTDGGRSSVAWAGLFLLMLMVGVLMFTLELTITASVVDSSTSFAFTIPTF